MSWLEIERLLCSTHSNRVQSELKRVAWVLSNVLVWNWKRSWWSDVVMYFDRDDKWNIVPNLIKIAPSFHHFDDLDMLKVYHRLHNLMSNKIFNLPLFSSNIWWLDISWYEFEVLWLDDSEVFEWSSLRGEPIFISNVPYVWWIDLSELNDISWEDFVKDVVFCIQKKIEEEFNVSMKFRCNNCMDQCSYNQLWSINIKVSLIQKWEKNYIRFIVTDLAWIIQAFANENLHLDLYSPKYSHNIWCIYW